MSTPQPTPEPEVVERYDFPRFDRYEQRIGQENFAYTKRREAWRLACAPGTKVFRPNRYDGCCRGIDVREGIVVRIDVGIINNSGSFYEQKNGPHYQVVAKFARDLEGRCGDDWYSQTCEGHEFHLTREGALKRLIEYLIDQADDKERDAKKLRERAAQLQEKS